MRKRFYMALIICVSAFLVTACSKGGGGGTDDGSGGGPHVISVEDTTRPVLEILSPVNNQVYTGATSIAINGKISDDLGLYRGSIRVTNDANGDLLKEQLYEIHGVLLYNYSINVPVSVSVPADYTVTVFFEDHGLNSVSRSVKVKVNP